MIDPSSLGRRTGLTLNETYLYINSFLLFSLLVVVITVILFLRSTLQSDNPKIRWKGKFIFLGMLISIIAAVIGIIIQDTPFTIILTRSLYIIGGIAAYIGWLMPERIAKWLIKEDKK
jgi:amino acid transporter